MNYVDCCNKLNNNLMSQIPIQKETIDRIAAANKIANPVKQAFAKCAR